jgi:hypothetical protein
MVDDDLSSTPAPRQPTAPTAMSRTQARYVRGA